jgi:hypothetical protein
MLSTCTSALMIGHETMLKQIIALPWFQEMQP